MTLRHPLFAALLIGFVCAILAGSPRAGAQELEKLEFVTKSGTHAFSVEVMRTPDQQAKGLMFRRFLPDDRGMLFAFRRNEPIFMWMKNTYIPLDRSCRSPPIPSPSPNGRSRPAVRPGRWSS